MLALNTLTMSSREMAVLTDKRHDSVKRTIETLAENGTISQPQIGDGPKAANGHAYHQTRFTPAGVAWIAQRAHKQEA